MPAVRGPVQRLGLFRAGLLTAALLHPAQALNPSPGVSPGAAPTPAAPIPAAATPVVVRFIAPAAPGLVLGSTRITVEAATSADARITKVTIHVDGDLITILETAPYTVTWDAGTRFGERVLRAVATDSAGRIGEAVLRVRPLYVGQYEEVRLVTLYASVRDRRGQPVLTLDQGDFVLLEDGVPQSVSHFTSAEVPLTVAILLDASNSMNLAGKIDLAKKAAEEFVDSVDPADRLSVISFNDEVTGLQEPVSDRRRLKEAIARVQARGGTALYDAVYRTAGQLSGAEGRRAIVLLSDGRDQALTDNEPGSLHLFEEALETAHRSEVALYTIGLGAHLESELDLARTRSLRDILEQLARETGGRSYFPDRAGQLSGIYTQIAADLKHQYALAYVSTQRAHDGRWRAITLRTRQPGLEVRTRAGYYAPKPPGGGPL